MTREEREILYLEIEVEPGVFREDEFEVPYEVEPYVPGYTSGPPEKCYPPEGGYANGYGPVIHRYEDSRGEHEEEMPWSVFVELWARLYEADMEYAEDRVNEELYECWQERLAARDDAEADRRAHEWMERGEQ